MSKVKYPVYLDEETVNWYKETYPEGSIGHLLNHLFMKFRQAAQHPSREYIEIAAKELSQELG